VQTFNCIRCPDRFPLAFQKAREGEQPVAGFFQAGGDRWAFRPPFAAESLALGRDLLLRAGGDHILVIGKDFRVQPLRRRGEKIAMLVHGAALNQNIAPERGKGFLAAGRAIDDGAFRRLQSPFVKVWI
jgi:hypothetical protein